MIPRPYQREAVDAVKAKLALHRSTILVAATGCGKTVMFGLLCKEWPVEYGRILILAHRRELIRQAYKTCSRICPNDRVDIEMGDRFARHHSDLYGAPSRIVVASKDTMCSQRRLARFDPSQFGLVIVDEAHHAVKKNATYSTVMSHFKRAKFLGVTATPKRGDNESLQGYFDTVAYVYDIMQAVNDSWLVPIRQRIVTVHGLDLSQIRTAKRGDLDPEELDRAMRLEPVLAGIIGPTIDFANADGKRRKALVFGTSVWQAQRMAEMINRIIPNSAMSLSGKDPTNYRDAVLERYARGGFQFLFGCDVFTEGFDEPTISIVVPKPTKVESCYAQMIGRGTRPLAGTLDGEEFLHDEQLRRFAIAMSDKSDLLVVDPHGVSGKHKLVTSFDILGGVFSPEVRLRARDRTKNGNYDVDAVDEMRKARLELEREEAERRKGIVIKAVYSSRPVDPFDLFDVSPEKCPTWLRGKPATDKQLEYLRRHAPQGARLPDQLTLHEASTLIEGIRKKQKAGPPSEKMQAILRRYGYPTDDVTYAQAQEIIDGIAAAGWKAPVREPENAVDH